MGSSALNPSAVETSASVGTSYDRATGPGPSAEDWFDQARDSAGGSRTVADMRRHSPMNEPRVSRLQASRLSPIFVMTVALVATLLAPTPSGATSMVSAESELRSAARASDPGERTWSLDVRPGWAPAGLRIDGQGAMIRVRDNKRRVTTWNIDGQQPLGQLINGRVPAEVLAEAGKPRARWVRSAGGTDRYVVHETVTTTDVTVRPDLIALWLADSGSLYRAAGNIQGERPAGSLPSGVERMFFDDGESPVTVSVTVSDSGVTGYRVWQRSKWGDERLLTVTFLKAGRKILPPVNSTIITLDALQTALELAGSPERVMSALPEPERPYDAGSLTSAIRSPAGAIPGLTVSPTRTGVALIPELRTERDVLSASRCVDLPASRPQPRPCTSADSAVLPEELLPYASWLRRLAEDESLTDEQIYWGLHSLNHNLWLYSGIEMDRPTANAWYWFYLDTMTRAMSTRDGEGKQTTISV